MHYLIYKTTCTINGKYYVGKHKTNNLDDGYLGSGRLLRAAIRKYGRENFVREIILECSIEDEMNLAEKILVVPDVEVNYNLCPGGQGGWGYLNANGLNISENQQNAARKRLRNLSNEERSLMTSKGNRTYFLRNGITKAGDVYRTSFLGQNHTEETKIKIGKTNSIKQAGSRNSQFGTCWMTNGAKNVKIKRDEVDRWIEMGYKQGRNMILG